jgi:hypothetical protein
VSRRSKLLYLEPVNEALTLIAGGSYVVEGIDISGKVIGQEEEAVVLDGITYRRELRRRARTILWTSSGPSTRLSSRTAKPGV